MGFEVKEILSKKDKERRAKAYLDWLRENGFLEKDTTPEHLAYVSQELQKITAEVDRLSTEARKLSENLHNLITDNK